MPQFELKIGKIVSNVNGTLIQGSIQLKRIPFYHILCTYLPTVCILLMTIATLYVDESHFESTTINHREWTVLGSRLLSGRQAERRCELQGGGVQGTAGGSMKP